MANQALHIALAGNPNCGKTTLFNLITGQNGYVGNWPGVTVEKKEAPLSRDKSVVVTDLPGIYSLSPYSPEERVSRDYLMGGDPDVVIQVIDATNLERNLYLALQVIETGVPVVVALNMADLVERSGDKIDAASLEKSLGCPVVMISALKNTGVDGLIDAAREEAIAKRIAPRHAFDAAIEGVLKKIESQLPASVEAGRRRYFAVKLFERDADALAALSLPHDASERIEALVAQCEKDCDDDAESIITAERYGLIAHMVDACLKKAPAKMSTSERIDRVVTNRWLGLPIFAFIMFGVYYLAISTFGTAMTDWVNDNLFGDGWELFGAAMPSVPALFEGWLSAAGASDMVISLVCDGIVAGVGAVLGFIPQMFVLFVLLSFLEDCGYMARVAFVMDRVFRRFGLSGKSFIPMLVSTGCGVPGVLATKTIENEKDRRMTVMTTTFIPCGAKLPVIALVMGALIGDAESTWIAPLFYFLGVVAVIVSGVMLKKTRLFAGRPTPFVMELPAYHLPSPRSWALHVWERVSAYIKKAFTIIFASTVVVWFLSSFGVFEGAFGYLPSMAGVPEEYTDHSLLALVAGAVSWIFAPLGFDTWQATAMSVTGLVAKENVMATAASLLHLADATETDPSLWSAFAALFPSAGAIAAFGAFNLLCAPCFAAMGTIRAQMGSAKWTAIALGYECGFAWVVGLMINQFYLAALGKFSVWTVVAAACALLILFQLFRPMPSYAWDEGVARAGVAAA
ncbi:ferrous iron transport protein B [Collinsella stercoris]|uniref:Ferrous iron transport protein B n=1 Tax=Collinsella stercoris DSM 13279 TaxID=445975 RepID=B6GAV3_9ACTN|nr:ferrous iron transport protein B [Collinsella stercoris]EEA90629.1 ferrous iron transport protein B [Collinsella stercoris DSM 13279]UEA45562.1 ferrous iron transport protein B [Collinsella stercoris DSM 13279]UWP11913.1 ferrous iron transport protein B [Collinsella stercoris]